MGGRREEEASKQQKQAMLQTDKRTPPNHADTKRAQHKCLLNPQSSCLQADCQKAACTHQFSANGAAILIHLSHTITELQSPEDSNHQKKKPPSSSGWFFDGSREPAGFFSAFALVCSSRVGGTSVAVPLLSSSCNNFYKNSKQTFNRGGAFYVWLFQRLGSVGR